MKRKATNRRPIPGLKLSRRIGESIHLGAGDDADIIRPCNIDNRILSLAIRSRRHILRGELCDYMRRPPGDFTGWLVLSRRVGQSIDIDGGRSAGGITIHVVEINANRCKLSIEAPRDVLITRGPRLSAQTQTTGAA